MSELCNTVARTVAIHNIGFFADGKPIGEFTNTIGGCMFMANPFLSNETPLTFEQLTELQHASHC